MRYAQRMKKLERLAAVGACLICRDLKPLVLTWMPEDPEPKAPRCEACGKEAPCTILQLVYDDPLPTMEAGRARCG
jgi:hypothetical protein